MHPEIVLLDNNYNFPLAIKVKCCEEAHKLVWEHKSTKTHPNTQLQTHLYFLHANASVLKKRKKKNPKTIILFNHLTSGL